MTIDLNRRAALGGLAAAGLGATLAGCDRLTLTPKSTDESGFTAVPDGKVWWNRVASGNKTPMLMLHGGPGAGHNYLTPMKVLADERPVIFYDQLGCGKSDAPEDPKIYTVARYVQEVDAIRKALGLEKVILFGHSWGSMLAIEYMLTSPNAGSVEKLILGGALASVPQAMAGQDRLIDAMPNGDGKKLRALEAAGKQSSKEYQDLVGEFYALHVCRKTPPPKEFMETGAILEKSPAYRIMNGPNEFTITGVIKDWERRPDLPKIKVPTYITTGEFDEVTLDCHQSINQGIAGSKLEVFPGLSHVTMLEDPIRYNAAVRKFIS
ncbi:MAG: proline iminopeptidase-family hydrolase [Proteobacteria bacterium]|nr:proline iminopeptidase-family hydrolase [Pseudomonadota bacterium]